MELYVFNSSRQLAGIVESFEYLRWTRRYSQCGSFELKAIATPENTALLKAGNILWKSDDEEAGIIEHLELSQTDNEIITATGRLLPLSWLVALSGRQSLSQVTCHLVWNSFLIRTLLILPIQHDKLRVFHSYRRFLMCQ